ncbi:MAG: hypothetical protein RBS39_13785 [Phycisphaerales bacterium]|jgi:hypothetical protein|nr:hypothetical protein [Phycisphaerales bacterium]
MNENKGCDSCWAHDTSTLEKVGETEHNEYLGGKAREDINYYRCKDCRTKWQHISESGAGGRGRFWNVVD